MDRLPLHRHTCSVRVYEAAKLLGCESRAVLAYLAEQGHQLSSASSAVPGHILDSLLQTERWDVRSAYFRAKGRTSMLEYPPWPQLVTTSEAAFIAQVEPATIRQWVHRGVLSRAEIRGFSRTAMFLTSDVIAARTKTRARRREMAPEYHEPNLTARTARAAVTASQASAYLGIPGSTIRSWARRQRIELIAREGRTPIYSMASIYALLRDRNPPDDRRDLPDWGRRPY